MNNDNITITLDIGRRLSNFSLAQAMYYACADNGDINIDPKTVALMMLEQCEFMSKFDI